MKSVVISNKDFYSIVDLIESALPGTEVVGIELSKNQYQAIVYGVKHNRKNRFKKAIINIYEGKDGTKVWPVGKGDVLKLGTDIVSYLTI